MKKLICFILLSSLPLSGCARYQDYSQAVVDSNEHVATARTQIAKDVVNVILSKFDQADRLGRNTDSRKPMVTFEYTDAEGNYHTNTVYHTPQDPGIAIFMKGAARAMVIRETVPLVEALIKDMSQRVSKPVTAEDILYRIAEDGALIVTMGTMYGMTKSLIDNVRSNISASSESGSTVSIDSNGTTSSEWKDDDSKIIEMPAESEEE